MANNGIAVDENQLLNRRP